MPPPRVTLALALACSWTAVGCGSSRSPVQAEVGTGVVETSVGPGGQTILGRGPLTGLALEIPAGALRELVRLRLEPGEPVEFGDTVAASVGVRIVATPDPGALLVPARLTMRVRFPDRRSPADLFIVHRVQRPGAPGRPPRDKVGLAAELGTFDQDLDLFSADIGLLTPLQVRYTAAPRQIDDANGLVELALQSLDRLTDESVAAADQQLAQALRADPLFPAARLLRAVTRLLAVVNDRASAGPGLQSLGEAATAFGLDLQRSSLLRRVVDGDWPHRLSPPGAVPSAGDVLELLQGRVRPAVEASLDDLEFVPLHARLRLPLPSAITALPGEREIDAADVLLLRAALALLLYGFDAFEDLDLEVDTGFLASPAARDLTPQDLLARFPRAGGRRGPAGERTQQHLAEALTAAVQGYRQLNVETDPQEDDLVVFSSSFDARKRDLWQGNVERALRSLTEAGGQSVRIDPDRALELDLGALLEGLDFRALAPALSGFEVLAGTLPDPTFGGLLPAATQHEATQLLHSVNRFELPPVLVTIDGEVHDWPAASEALLPADPTGDAGGMDGLDLGRLFLGLGGDDLVCRLSLARGRYEFRQGESRVYGFELHTQRQRPEAGGPRVRIAVEMTASGPEVTVRRDGEKIAVRHQVAVGGAELEIALDRFDLFDPDEPVRDRVLRAFSAGLDRAAAGHGDETRRVLLRF